MCVMLVMVIAIYNALVTMRRHEIGDTFYGRLAAQAHNVPWVMLHPWWLSVASALLPISAGWLGLRLRNHLHALTAVTVCLMLMIIQPHLVSSALIAPLFEVLNGVSKTFGVLL